LVSPDNILFNKLPFTGGKIKPIGAGITEKLKIELNDDNYY